MEISPLPQNTPKIPDTSDTKDTKKLKEAVAGFEAIFLQQILTSMRRTVPEDGIMSGGSGGKMFQEMMDVEYAKAMSARDNHRGLKEDMFHQLTMARSSSPRVPITDPVVAETPPVQE